MNATLVNGSTSVVSSTAAVCEVCGASPAIPVKLVNHRGYVLALRLWNFRATLCRDCGLGMFRYVQNRDLMFGWWGIASVFLNTYAVLNNLIIWMRLQGLSEPIRNCDRLPIDAGRPLYGRPGIWIASAAALFLGFAAIDGIGQNDPRTFSASDQALIGTCQENVGDHESQPADCAGPHSGKVVFLRHSRYGCYSSQVAIDLHDGAYACSDTRK
jgi:hypothetical protein